MPLTLIHYDIDSGPGKLWAGRGVIQVINLSLHGGQVALQWGASKASLRSRLPKLIIFILGIVGLIQVIFR
jgi:hypothetical protein